jgi:outer membrane protein
MLAVGLAAPAWADVKIGVVDMQRALNECNAGRKAKDQVRSKFERAQNELKAQRESLDRMRESYDKKALVLKEDERRSLEKDLEVKSLDFKRKYEDYQRDLKRTDAELTSGIVEQLYGIVGTYAKEKGYTVVLETSSGALVYAEPSIDMTDEVIKRHNAR